MSHFLGPDADAANKAADTKTVDLVVITLPDPTDPVTFYFATSEVTVDGQFYEARIKAMPNITYSAGGNANGGDFVISNAGNIYGPAFINTSRALDGGSVVITRAFKILAGTWQKIDPGTGKVYEIGRGILRTQPVSDEEIKCNFVDDWSNTSVTIGGQQEAQHCLKVFRRLLSTGPDTYHPLGGPCGWLVAMGGNPDECDHTLDGPNGCKAHGNTRTDGIPDLSPVAAAITGSGPVGTGGGPSGGGGPSDGYGDPLRKPIDFDPDLRLPFVV
jgi:hypothetical protein